MARKLTEAELLDELRTVECELEPENLHCDGEITRAAARRKKTRLDARRAKLVKALGREPTDRELWN